VKVHRNVTLIEVDDPLLLTELETATGLSDLVFCRLSTTAVLVDDRQVEQLLKEMVSRGYTPRVSEP